VHRLPTTELSPRVVWHGHTEDLPRLVESADANCTCGRGEGPDRLSRPCGTHQILADQHTLDHLAFARSVLHRLIEEEWRVPAIAETRADRAEWSAFLHVCARASEPAPVRVHRPDRSPRTAPLTTWVISLIALVLILGVHGPGGDAPPHSQPAIASWQTR
jgi:hypothetical protein